MNTCDTDHMIATVRRLPNRITLYLVAAALSMSLGLGGCGHQDSTAADTTKVTTSYQGKPDTPPWDNSRWHDDKADWERAIRTREQNQNEYVRIPN